MTPRLMAGTAVAALSAGALRLAAPAPVEAVRLLGSAERAADVSVPLVAGASLLAWALLAHLVLVGLLTALAALPGRSGAAGDAALRRCAPEALRRLVAVALGVGIVVGAGGGVASASAPAAKAGPVISLDWPGAGPAAPAAVPAAAPAAASPTSASAAAPRDAPAPASSGRDLVAPDQPAPARSVSPDRVRVAPGDTLWDLSREALPTGATDREVAQAWPDWWSANRAVIGDDPDLLHPGQALRAPR